MMLFRSGVILMMIVFLLGCHNTKKSTPITCPDFSGAIGVNKNDFTPVQTKYAEILKVTPKEIDNLPLYHFIDQWIGVKYKFGGTTTEGVDCSGFANILYKEVYKTVLPRSSKDIAKELKTISKTNLSEGDILIFDIENKKNSHVGIYLKNNKFVHSSTSNGVIISSLELPYYQKAFSKARQL